MQTLRRGPRSGFSLIELLAVVTIIGLLLGILIPTIQARREASRRNQCQDNLKQIGLALANHESAYDRYPLVFNAPVDLPAVKIPQAYLAAPAGTGSRKSPGKMTGWSWLVRILPYVQCSNVYKNIDICSEQFSVTPTLDYPSKAGPFDKAIINGSATYQHSSCNPMLGEFVCPAWTGDANTHGTSTIDTSSLPSGSSLMPTGAPEYAKLLTMEPSAGAPPAFVGLPAPTNYKAIVGTHLYPSGGKYPHAPVEDGGMALTGNVGRTATSISDGLSKTLAVAETRECGYASWYDGTMNWLVTNNPNAKLLPGANNSPPWTSAETAINRGYDPAKVPSAANAPYLSAPLSINGIVGNENWGPSSQHANGAVMHVYYDCHVEAITDQCDPETYLDITTRSGAEAIKTALIR